MNRSPYHFPALLGSLLNKEGIIPHVGKLAEEVDEVRDAVFDYEYERIRNGGSKGRMEALMEVVDVMHVCETLLRYMKVGDDELNDVLEIVKLKNKLRGYYGDYDG